MIPLISVVIPAYNRENLISGAIESVLNQTDKNFELIVVNDGSTDNTEGVILKYKANLKYISQENKGPSAARNRGISESHGEFIAFLDSDDIWIKTKLEKQREPFNANPDLMIVHSDEIWIRNGIRVNQMKKHQKGGGDQFERALELCIISPSAVLLRKEVFHEVGMWDENFHFAEDYDLWLRILSKYPAGYLSEPLVIKHGGHPDQQSRKFIGGDKYRIFALVKILYSKTLNQKQTELVINSLIKKSVIYGKGCIKHGKTKEGEIFLEAAEKIQFEKIFALYKEFSKI